MKKVDDYKVKPNNLRKILDPEFLKTNNPNQELLGVTDEILGAYYYAAVQLLEEKNWMDARDAFRFLTFLNPCMHDFWVGLGISEQAQEKFQDAFKSYVVAIETDPADPVAHANAFQCCKALGDNAIADEELKKAVECCGNEPKFSELKGKLQQYNKQ